MLFTHKLLLSLSLIGAVETLQADNWTEFKLDNNQEMRALPSYSHMVKELVFYQEGNNQSTAYSLEANTCFSLNKSQTKAGCLELSQLTLKPLGPNMNADMRLVPSMLKYNFMISAPTMKCFYFNNQLIVFLGNEIGHTYEIAVFEKSLVNGLQRFKPNKSVKIMKLRCQNLDNIDSIALSDTNDCLIIGYTPEEIVGFYNNFIDGAII